MTHVVSEVSPLNCQWITWNDSLPVCTRPPQAPHRVTEAECSVCEFWNDDTAQPGSHAPHLPQAHPKPRHYQNDDPLNREMCPRCSSHDVVLMQRDALVQSFVCSICHQRWLATRPWPLLRETRSRGDDT
jgi:hypothetical protein